ncbi:MAG: MFS transporter [Proteobacteria bacterium]|nr:MFS transporter [Pseudomonadota bacterium]
MSTKVMLLITVILMDLLTGMEFDLFVPSFPELQSHFNLSPSLVEALLSVNFVGYALSLFFVGALADHYGRKPIILLGLSIFTMGSILCLLGKYELLLIGRFLQGIGIAAPSILSFLIIADSYPIKKQQYLMAMLNGVMNTAVAIAPVVGSYLTLYFHWQGNFVTLLLLGLISLVMTMVFIPTYTLPERAETVSFREYISLFQSKPLTLLVAHIVVMVSPYWIFVGMSPLLYMESLGVSLSHFGYYQGVLALIFAAGSVLFGLIINRFEQKKMLYFSNQIFIVSLICIGLASFFDNFSPLLITLVFIPFIIAQVVPSTILYPLCVSLMPQAKAKVSAVLHGTRLVFTALSLQVAGYFYRGSFRNIGIIISICILVVIVTLFFIIKNREIMKPSQESV